MATIDAAPTASDIDSGLRDMSAAAAAVQQAHQSVLVRRKDYRAQEMAS
jgi:hypothetical protein